MMKQCKFRKKNNVFFNFIFISFDALVQRYEPPEGRNRWDAPLFELTPNDELPLEQIADYLANKRPPPPNKSTVNVSLKYQLSRIFIIYFKLPISDTNFLHDVDRVTQDVLDVCR